MNPEEFDEIEHLQQTVFRPNSYNQARESIATLIKNLESKDKKIPGREEKAMYIRLSNLLKGNAAFSGYTEIDYLKDTLGNDTPAKRIAISRLMKDTNKGISDVDDQIDFPFTDGSKVTEKLAKRRLVERFKLDPSKFMLLPDAGPDRLMLDEKTNRLVQAKDLDVKAKSRSIDAVSELKNAVIIWCMKYKGGTAAVGGSGQKDQGTTEGMHFAAVIENLAHSGTPLTYKNKPVFFANLVYGGQFNDPKRIVENELSFKTDRDCLRSFNISLDRVKDVIDYMESKKFNVDTALKDLYNAYGYDLEYSGNPKPKEKDRLLEWNTNYTTQTV